MVAHQEVLCRSRDEPDGLLDSDTELFIVSLSGDGPLQLVTRCRARLSLTLWDQVGVMSNHQPSNRALRAPTNWVSLVRG